jgi:hypothetical protein
VTEHLLCLVIIPLHDLTNPWSKRHKLIPKIGKSKEAIVSIFSDITKFNSTKYLLRVAMSKMCEI